MRDLIVINKCIFLSGMPLPMTNNMPYPPDPPNLNTGMVAPYPHPPGNKFHCEIVNNLIDV